MKSHSFGRIWRTQMRSIDKIYRGWLPHPVWYLNFRYPAANLKHSAEDLNPRPRILISDQVFESGFLDYSSNPRSRFLESDIWLRVSVNLGSLNWLGRRKLILSIYINRLLHCVWYLNFRCPTEHVKLSVESFRCAVGYLKFRYQTGRSNQPWKKSIVIGLFLWSQLNLLKHTLQAICSFSILSKLIESHKRFSPE